MAQMNFEFSGRKGLIALAGVVLLLVVQLASIGETKDSALKEAIHAELKNKMGRELSKVLKDVDPTSEEGVAAVLAQTDDENIILHSAQVSKPLLTFSSKTKTIVRLEYTMPGVNRSLEYWRFEHSVIAGWRYRYNTGVVSYYLNFF